MHSALSAAERLFTHTERTCALLARVRPENAASEAARLVRLWARGERATPNYEYRAPPCFGELQQVLSSLSRQLEPAGIQPPILARLYVARARELLRETEVVAALGTPKLRTAATARFVTYRKRDERDALQLSQQWVKLPKLTPETSLSDDESTPHSLLCRIQHMVGRLRLPIRVRRSRELSAAAATGDGVIFVAVGRMLTANDVDRIVLHEVFGHALPRYRAQYQSLGLYRVGSAMGSEEQEGYALWLEERAGLLDQNRRRELALRHLAAASVREGKDWVAVVDELQEYGVPLEESLTLAARVFRGGGLAREFVYLPSYCRMRSALAAQPELVTLLSRGRLSIAAIRQLSAVGVCTPEPLESATDLVEMRNYRNMI